MTTTPDPLSSLIREAVREALGELIQHGDLRTKRLYSAAEAAKYLGMCRQEIYRMANEGEIPAVKGGRRALIDADDLEAWIKNRKAQWLESRKEANQ